MKNGDFKSDCVVRREEIEQQNYKIILQNLNEHVASR